MRAQRCLISEKRAFAHFGLEVEDNEEAYACLDRNSQQRRKLVKITI